jgi:hypothetical protein
VYRIAFTGFAQLYHHKYKFAIPHPSFYFHSEKWRKKTPEALRRLGFSDRHLFRSHNVVAGGLARKVCANISLLRCPKFFARFCSQNFDRCHSFLLPFSATGGGRKRPLLRCPKFFARFCSQNFDRCHSCGCASSATGSAQPHSPTELRSSNS